MEWRSRKDGVAGRWRGSWSRAFVFAVAQDFSDGGGFETTRILPPQFFAHQWVDFEHTAEQVGPSSAKGFTLVEACADFLRFLLEKYGPASSRYSAKRIHVIVEPGDKYESPA